MPESENTSKNGLSASQRPRTLRRGRLQAEHLAEWMKAGRLTVLITKPLCRRTLLTAGSDPWPGNVLAGSGLARPPSHPMCSKVGGCTTGYEPATFTGARGHEAAKQIQNSLFENSPLVAAKSLQFHRWKSIRIGARDTTDLDFARHSIPKIDSDGWWKGRPRKTSMQRGLRALK